MVGNFFTNSISGIKFCQFQKIIINCDMDDFIPVNFDEVMASYFSQIDRNVSRHRVEGIFIYNCSRNKGLIQ
jgi:hypothetical protein